MWVAKPGKMRWDYAKPEKKYFISDGTTLWVYEEAAHQAIQQSLKDQIDAAKARVDNTPTSA